MQSIDELELPHLAVETPEFAENPLPEIRAARRRHPWLAKSNVGYVVTEYAAMDEILRKDGNMRMSSPEIVDLMGAHDTLWGKFTLGIMLSKSGAEHRRLRDSVAAAFRPRNVNRMRPVMRSVISDLLDEWAPKGAFDFAEFAANFPIRVMFGLIGASSELLPGIRESLEIQGSSYSLEVEKMPIIENAMNKLWSFVEQVVAERGPGGDRGDLLDDLIAINQSGVLNDEELQIMLIFLFAAGYDTSKNLLTMLMHSMLGNPDVWERCAEDRDYCDKVVKEQLRFGSPSNVYRLVTSEFEYRGVRFPENTNLFLPISVSGHDPDAFETPDVFDPEHNAGDRNLAFGRGIHLCLGQFLAQAQVEEGIHQIAQRITKPRLTGKVASRPFLGVWGIRSLPITFDPAPARHQVPA